MFRDDIDASQLKEQIKKFSPDRIHPLLKGIYRTAFPRSSDESKPEYYYRDPISKEYIYDTELVQNREALLNQLDENKVVAELGVDSGDFSTEILSITQPSELYLVDIWDTDRYNEKKMETVKSRFSEQIKSGQVNVIRQRSEKALQQFEDEFFDWVYIDTTHSYNQTKTELNLAKEKVKNGGIICGHDYSMGTPYKGIRYGVIEAVHEFCNENGYQLRYLSLETGGSRSYALQKIDLS